MRENVRAVAKRFYIEARLNGAPSVEHDELRDKLARWAELLGFVEDPTPFPGGVYPDLWGCLPEEPMWKFIGEAKAWQDPGDIDVQEQLFEYFNQAIKAVTRQRRPWKGFRFTLAYLDREDGPAWKTLLERLIEQAGFPPPSISEETTRGIPLLIWDFPPAM
jgi:hypothetical protein